ncbi:MAG: hypothetical protein QW197_03135 [Candidatus Aenigmatarchaeota archaeon]
MGENKRYIVRAASDLNKDDIYLTVKGWEKVPYLKDEIKKRNLDMKDFESMNPQQLVEILFKEGIVTKPENVVNGQLGPSDIDKYFGYLISTSGTTGNPKIFRFTSLGDGLVVYAQTGKDIVIKYFPENYPVDSAFPPQPSASGVMATHALLHVYLIDGKSYPYRQIPPQLLTPENFKLLVNTLVQRKPRVLIGLTTHVNNMLKALPKDVIKDLEVIVVAGEPYFLPIHNIENFDGYVIDIYGAGELGIPLYSIAKAGKEKSLFKLTKGAITLEIKEPFIQPDRHVAEVYVTKFAVNVPGSPRIDPLGLYAINHKIGDIAEINSEGDIVRFLRSNDMISLAGAKLLLSQVADVVSKFSETYPLSDFVVEYYPLSERNPKPRAIIYVGYETEIENKRNLEEEIRQKIFEINHPVNYEVNLTKAAELEVKLIPSKEILQKQYPRPGKTKRLYVIE